MGDIIKNIGNTIKEVIKTVTGGNKNSSSSSSSSTSKSSSSSSSSSGSKSSSSSGSSSGISANELEFFCGKGASLVYGEDGNYRTGTVPMFKDGKIINVDCSKAIDLRNQNGYIIMTSDTKLSGNIQNYSNLDTLNIADNSYASITNHKGGYIGTLNTGANSYTKVNNYGVMDTINSGKNSSLSLDNYGKINEGINIDENAIAIINNYNQDIDPGTGQYVIGITNITGKSNSKINVFNYGGIGEIHTGDYSENVIFNESKEAYVNWLETGLDNSSTTDGGTKKVSGNGELVLRLYKNGQTREIKVKNGDYDKAMIEADLLVKKGWSYDSPNGVNEELYKSSALYKHEVDLIAQINSINTEKFSWDINTFKKTYEKNKAIYEEISRKTGIPPELIAAIHYRESGCNFNTYLHNGDPLGKPTTHVPKGKNFDNFIDAAVDALSEKNSLKEKYKLTSNSNDMAAMMAFAESYNGLGYYNKDRVSPYVYSGTNMYKSGKYVSDGNYSATTVDEQPGVYILINSLKK